MVKVWDQSLMGHGAGSQLRLISLRRQLRLFELRVMQVIAGKCDKTSRLVWTKLML